MDSLYINRNLSREKGVRESAVSFYILYLFTQKVSLCSHIWRYIELWKTQSEWSDDRIVDLFLHSDNMRKDGSDAEKKTIQDVLKFGRKLKSKKFKTKQDLQQLVSLRQFMNNTKRILIDACKRELENAGVFNWLDLFNNDMVTLLECWVPDEMKATEEDIITPIIRDSITKNHEILLLGFDVEKIIHAIHIANENPAPVENGSPFFYSMPLFNFPECTNISGKTLQIMRNGLLSKMQPLTAIIKEFSENIINEKFNQNSEQKCRDFYHTLLPEIEVMQKNINNEIYFQHVINSIEQRIHLSLNLGVTSIESIIDYYELSGSLEPFIASALKRELMMYIDITKSYIFFYWTYDFLNVEGKSEEDLWKMSYEKPGNDEE